jgi:hypothetical protein
MAEQSKPDQEAKQIERLQKLGAEYEAFVAADCPVEDDYDIYPPELWQAATRPQDLLPLIASLQAQVEALRAEAEHARAYGAAVRAAGLTLVRGPHGYRLERFGRIEASRATEGERT